ncbi:MAG TPA: cytochrome C oxidase subunit IV family protein [Thermomicrobiales bacterium]|nr:cytochrome C oxidase subunit IV family protein [Thermomicrobiales bacterium]
MVQKTGSMPALDEHHEAGHPSLRKYVNIAIFLAIVTAIEVVIYYVEALESVLVPALIILSAAKFVTVVGYFMHLKFDAKLLTFIFGAALITSLAVYIAVDIMMDHRPVEWFYSGR